MDTRKAQDFTIRHTGLLQPTIHYGKPALRCKPLVDSSCSFTCRGSSSCGEWANKMSCSKEHGAKIQHFLKYNANCSGKVSRKCYFRGKKSRKKMLGKHLEVPSKSIHVTAGDYSAFPLLPSIPWTSPPIYSPADIAVADRNYSTTIVLSLDLAGAACHFSTHWLSIVCNLAVFKCQIELLLASGTPKDFDNESIYQIFLVGKAQKEADLEKSWENYFLLLRIWETICNFATEIV